MSGIIGHSMYALLGLRCAQAQELPIARVLSRHLPSYLGGAYLGCDVGTVPAAICQDTDQPVGYGAAKATERQEKTWTPSQNSSLRRTWPSAAQARTRIDMAEEAHGRGCPRCPGTGLKLRDFVIEQIAT